MKENKIHRRRFLLDTSAALALAAFQTHGLDLFSSAPPRRVALIGTGWYGKSDLFRLMQVAPVDVVALCDVDKQQLNKAAEMVSQRQKNKMKPALYGDKGTLCGSTMKYDFIPVGKSDKIHGDVLFEKEKYPEDLNEPAIELNAAPATRLHMLNFLEAIDKGIKPVADIEQGHISTASCILANISMQLKGRPLIYDPIKKVVVGDPEATNLLQRKYRSPWIHPLPEDV